MYATLLQPLAARSVDPAVGGGGRAASTPMRVRAPIRSESANRQTILAVLIVANTASWFVWQYAPLTRIDIDL